MHKCNISTNQKRKKEKAYNFSYKNTTSNVGKEKIPRNANVETE